ncbi:hypothetical protein AURDEDRAFT_183690 [Auricularia subglabra TFB-10046 SS5]|nr:hypothetical protein AURDEDRAFT_183690 [Auricularia subglabra TFB-10046 SS5]
MSQSRPGSRASQRPASRSSFRASSPAPDGAVGLRTQISTVKHEIRQQTARLQSLENALQRAPRPIPNLSPTSPENPLRRRSSLNDAALAANGNYDSLIPVPARNRNSNTHQQGIKEGVPLESLQTNLATAHRHGAGSPTRSISRIPVASVGHARTLAEEGAASPSDTSGLLDPLLLQAPPSPGATSTSSRRSVGGGGNTTRVLADLQAGVLSARSALENTKGQLRQSQRTVAQLTRQTEDLKEGRERLRIEIEGLNNVVARKERLLQEVLERARKAEAEATALKTQLKTETASTKRSLRDMEAALSEATALSQKSASEYSALQSSFARLGDSWRRELEGVREEMRAREETLKKEADEIGVKYKALVKLVQASAAERARLENARKEAAAVENAFAEEFRGELRRLADEVERSSAQGREDSRMTTVVKDELARILRLMQALGRASASDDEDTTLDLGL